MRPQTLVHYRTAVIEEIAWAFRHVTREGGVSWSETEVLDNYGGEVECAAARESDKDRHWSELVNDSRWDDRRDAFSLLDPVGYRYYLPLVMTRAANHQSRAELSIYLTLDTTRCEQRDWRLAKWSAFTDEQCAAVARFLHFMALDNAVEGRGYGNQWIEALNSHWHKWLYKCYAMRN